MASDSIINDLPFVLCPDIEGHGIRVTPLWFRPKGGGKECPVIILESVPVGFNTVLDAKGFLQRPEGWLIDVHDKDEEFWRPIFGDIGFIQKKPVKVYEPNKIVFAPPPATVKVVIRNFTDEHIQYLTKAEQVIGTEAVRASKNDALRGAVNCRGAWSIIKAAVLDRLARNPEDVTTFEYVWATAKTQSLDVRDLPTSIPHESLLRKIVERQRITAQMEQVVSSWFLKDGAAPFAIYVNWQQRSLHSGSVNGGPIERRDFNEVEGIAQYLLDMLCEPLDDKSIIEEFQNRISKSQSVNTDDWVAGLDIPVIESPDNIEQNTDKKKSDSFNKSTDCTDLNWNEVYVCLDRLFQLSERRIAYARMICRYLFLQIINQEGINLYNHTALDNFEKLIGLFGKVTNFKSLQKLWERESHTLLDLLNALTVPGSSKFNLLKIFQELSDLNNFIEHKLLECEGERLGWWWSGYACSKTASNNEWQIFKLNLKKKSSHPIGTGLYSSPLQADKYLYKFILSTRIDSFKSSPGSDQWFIGYKTTTGPILQLSDTNVCDPVAEKESINYQIHSSFFYPKLWMKKFPQLDPNYAFDLINIIVNTFGLDVRFADFSGRLSFSNYGSRLHANWDGKPFREVHSGNIALVWSEALNFQSNAPELNQQKSMIMDLLKGNPSQSDHDISLEDDLLDTLEVLSKEIVARIGSVAESLLRKAIVHPSEESEQQCVSYWYALLGEKASDELVTFIRSVTLYAAQNRTFIRLSLAYLECLRLNLPQSILFDFAVVRLIALRTSWAGKRRDELTAVSQPGDIPGAELFPDEEIQWKVFCALDGLLNQVITTFEINQDKGGLPNVISVMERS